MLRSLRVTCRSTEKFEAIGAFFRDTDIGRSLERLEVDFKYCIPQNITDIALLHSINSLQSLREITLSGLCLALTTISGDFNVFGIINPLVCAAPPSIQKLTVVLLLMEPPEDAYRLFERNADGADANAVSQWARLEDEVLKRNENPGQRYAELKLDVVFRSPFFALGLGGDSMARIEEIRNGSWSVLLLAEYGVSDEVQDIGPPDTPDSLAPGYLQAFLPMVSQASLADYFLPGVLARNTQCQAGHAASTNGQCSLIRKTHTLEKLSRQSRLAIESDQAVRSSNVGQQERVPSKPRATGTRMAHSGLSRRAWSMRDKHACDAGSIAGKIGFERGLQFLRAMTGLTRSRRVPITDGAHGVVEYSISTVPSTLSRLQLLCAYNTGCFYGDTKRRRAEDLCTKRPHNTLATA
ncbi:hypothetical protein NM688_g3885 [Phlebia brevispora]|uniref:Uncharacterized protein n=1 Tax=Phlebia brevispora TaxID=194682 RepID=A0ACC1T472_9APHY|nr:hypothetical protein NM688_g3885 [Phlebia brevispora]